MWEDGWKELKGEKKSKGGSWRERRKGCEQSPNVTRTCFLWQVDTGIET